MENNGEQNSVDLPEILPGLSKSTDSTIAEQENTNDLRRETGSLDIIAHNSKIFEDLTTKIAEKSKAFLEEGNAQDRKLVDLVCRMFNFTTKCVQENNSFEFDVFALGQIINNEFKLDSDKLSTVEEIDNFCEVIDKLLEEDSSIENLNTNLPIHLISEEENKQKLLEPNGNSDLDGLINNLFDDIVGSDAGALGFDEFVDKFLGQDTKKYIKSMLDKYTLTKKSPNKDNLEKIEECPEIKQTE